MTGVQTCALPILAYVVHVVDDEAIHVPMAVTEAHNADFDGDEGALMFPQSYTVKAEAEYLMLVDYNLLHQGRPVINLRQHASLGLILLSELTAEDSFSPLSFFHIWSQAYQVPYSSHMVPTQKQWVAPPAAFVAWEEALRETEQKTAVAYKGPFSGVALLEALWPPDFQVNQVIVQGKLLRPFKKEDLNTTEGLLFAYIQQYGFVTAAHFLSQLYAVTYAFIAHKIGRAHV